MLTLARVAELVDAQDLKSCIRKGVRVRFPSRAPARTLLASLPPRYRGIAAQKPHPIEVLAFDHKTKRYRINGPFFATGSPRRDLRTDSEVGFGRYVVFSIHISNRVN